MRVPFLDLQAQYLGLREEILEALDRLGQRAEFTLGPEVEAFEQEFARFCGLRYAVAVNSGTSALHLALLAAGVGPGDEVVTTPFTFFATVEAILYTGAWPVIADRIRELRNHGQRERYRHETVGFNYRMEAFQAAILRIKLRWLPQWNEARYQLASLYRHRLTGTRVELPVDDPRARVVYHVFAIRVEERDRVRAELTARGVETAVYYPRPLHLEPACRPLGYGPGSFPEAERLAAQVLCLPLYPEMTREQAEYVAEAVREIVGQR